MNNVPEYSVTQINLEIKSTLERNFEYVCIKGESGSITIAKSGHAYFSIKENDEVLSCICWRGNLENLNIKIEEGVEYNFFGRITSYAKFGRSTYQLIIDQVEFSGEGSILKLIEERKKKYEKLGYFDSKFKLQIPKFPETIIVITSPIGAVIRDIIQRVSARYPIAKLLLCPVNVQGKTTHKEIIEYLDLLIDQRLPFKPSLIIFARGGGSLEEMMPFNESSLIEKVFQIKIPTISAIGHETDYTLLDYVSDLRAPTPSAAAEVATPDQKVIIDSLKIKKIRFNKSIKSIYKNYLFRVKQFNNGLNSSIKRNYFRQEKISFLINNNINIFNNRIDKKKENYLRQLSQIEKNNPKVRIKNIEVFFDNYFIKLRDNIKNKLKENIQKTNFYGRIIKNSSIDKNLNKGYTLILDKKNLIKKKSHLSQVKEFKIKFQDGDVIIKKN